MYRYCEHESTRIWLGAWCVDDELVQLWKHGEPFPQRILEHVARGGRVIGHNINFERQIWNAVLRRENPMFPKLEIAQTDDTMARALAVHLPASLDELGTVLGLSAQKDKEGAALMMRMARPRKVNPDGSYLWWDEPEKIERLGRYCMQDVETEREADKRLPPLSPDERELWERDQRINDRGVMLDVRTIEAAVAVREVAKKRADARMAELTGGAVRKATENAKLVAWLAARGLPCESIAKGEHAELIAFAEALGDDEAAAVVRLRGDAGKSSTAKLETMLVTVCADGRARGLFGYHRALTGRWGGAKCQPQNLPRVDEEKDIPDVQAAIRALEMFDADAI